MKVRKTIDHKGRYLNFKTVAKAWASFADTEIADEQRLKDLDTEAFGTWFTEIIRTMQADKWYKSTHWADNALPCGTEDRMAYRAYAIWTGLDNVQGEMNPDLRTMMEYIYVANDNALMLEQDITDAYTTQEFLLLLEAA